MRIDDPNIDPVKFVIEKEDALREEMSTWHGKTLKVLLDNHDLPSSGNKPNQIDRVLDAVKLETIKLSKLREWSYRFLREGNRHLFIYDVIPEDINRIKNIGTLQEILEKHEIKKKDELFKKVRDGLVFFDFTTQNEEVSKISLVYKEEKVLKVPNYSNNTIETETIDYYIFIDIDVTDGIMLINLDPRSGLRESNENDDRVSLIKIAQRYKEEIETLFLLHFRDTNDVTQKALYRVWKDATQYVLPEVEQELGDLTDEITKFVDALAADDKLNLKTETKTSLLKKILSNVEHSILKDRYEDYEEIIKQARNARPGFITEHKIRERTGSTLSQKSADKVTPIEESDSFSDTKVTIDQLERVQRLQYTWSGLEGIAPGVIPTIIESKPQYDYVIFTSYATVEEIAHVISQLKRYKTNVRSTRSDHT